MTTMRSFRYFDGEFKKTTPFYQPTDRGFGREVSERLKKVRDILS